MPTPRYTRRVRPTPSAGMPGITSGDVHAATAPYREIERAGSIITEVGLKALQMNEQAKYHDEVNRAKTQVLSRYTEYEMGVLQEADTEKYVPDLEKLQAELKDQIKFTDKRAEDDFNTWYSNEVIRQNRAITTQKLGVDARNFRMNFNDSLKTREGIAINASSKQDYQNALIELADMCGYGLKDVSEEEAVSRSIEGVSAEDFEQTEDWDNPLLWNKETRKAVFESALADVQTKRQKVLIDMTKAAIWQQATATVRPDGEVDWSEAVKWFSQAENIKGIDSKIIDSSLEDAKSQLTNQVKRDEAILEEQKEKDKDFLNDKFANNQIPTEGEIDNTVLTEDEQKPYIKWAVAETRRVESGEGIVTDSKIRTQFYRDITHILTGAQTRNDVLKRVQEARFGENPTIDEADYQKLLTAMEAQYEQGYGQMVSKVNSYAEGMLLNPDSLGYIKNAPIRYKTLGDFQEEWLQWVARQGENLKIADIYPEGRRIAASFQISDREAERQEEEMNKELEAREREKSETFVGAPRPKTNERLEAREKKATGKAEKRIEGETIQEYLERTGL